jgi:hypothetical protein
VQEIERDAIGAAFSPNEFKLFGPFKRKLDKFAPLVAKNASWTIAPTSTLRSVAKLYI